MTTRPYEIDPKRVKHKPCPEQRQCRWCLTWTAEAAMCTRDRNCCKACVASRQRVRVAAAKAKQSPR